MGILNETESFCSRKHFIYYDICVRVKTLNAEHIL